MGVSNKDLVLVVSAGFFIVMVVGIFIRNMFDWYVVLLYWLVVFGGAGVFGWWRFQEWKERKSRGVKVIVK